MDRSERPVTASPSTRTVEESLVEMTEIVLPEDSNPRGSIFGGRVLALIDKCAAVVAMRHSQHQAVTVALDSVVFVNKVCVGNVLILTGHINAAFGSSMEVEVAVHSENPLTGERKLTTTAFVTLVAVDDHDRPCRVPGLETTNDEERRRAAEAAARRRRRLEERSGKRGQT
jgi:acyl-CoA hydrolase